MISIPKHDFLKCLPAMEETVVLMVPSLDASSLMSSALSIVFWASFKAFLARLAKFEDGNQLMASYIKSYEVKFISFFLRSS